MPTRQRMSVKTRRTAALLRAATRGWPLTTPFAYNIRPSNKQLRISRGVFVLTQGRREWRLSGSLYLTWFPSPSLRFSGAVKRGRNVPEHGDDSTLRAPHAQPAKYPSPE